jgi:hypothetical protein
MKYIPDEKLCKKCGTMRPLDQFYKQARGLYGRNSQCKPCQESARAKRDALSPGKGAAAMREWVRKNPDKKRNNHLKYTYGITLAQFKEMEARQDGKCAICGFAPDGSSPSRTGKRLHVDHCHDTGIVRGLLCGNCNIGIGNLQHSLELLEKAKVYLLVFG